MTTFPQLSDLSAYPQATLHTNKGDIRLAFFPQYAPKAVENFLTHAKDGYYDGLIFHRVIEDFMIQGGDPAGDGTGGQSIWGDSFEDEFSRELFNIHGALSMANAGPHTNGSQFFIVTAKHVPSSMLGQLEAGGWPEEIIEAYGQVGGTPWLDHRHTVFGQVVAGMETVYAIEGLEKNAMDKPLEDAVIQSITVH